jgi:membrane protease YdiL (CAAX protease family)
LERWRKISAAFLAAAVGICVSWWLSEPTLDLLGVSADAASGLAQRMATRALFTVVPAIIVARATGFKRSDLYLSRGRPARWLTIGLLSFGAFACVFLVLATEHGLTPRQLIADACWILLYVFSVSFLEEVLVRGLFLRAYTDLLGRIWGHLSLALVFVSAHVPLAWSSGTPVFLLKVLLLGLALGFVVEKTKSLWGAVLLHAGANLPILLFFYVERGFV